MSGMYRSDANPQLSGEACVLSGTYQRGCRHEVQWAAYRSPEKRYLHVTVVELLWIVPSSAYEDDTRG